MTKRERRKNKERNICNFYELLNQHQMSALSQMESSGWQVFCVRISLFQDPVVVVVNADGDTYATLEYDGEFNLTPDLSLRKDDLRVYTVKKTTPFSTSDRPLPPAVPDSGHGPGHDDHRGSADTHATVG